MANFVKVCKTGDVNEGCGKSIEINGINVAVFKVAGNFYALNYTCGHRGGPQPPPGVRRDGVSE